MERSGGKGLRGDSSPLGKRWLNQGWWKINSTATFSILSECVYLCCYYIKIIVKEADHFLFCNLAAGQTVVEQDAYRPIFERSAQPQANTCTDLMTVFCGSHVAAGEMYMFVCVSLE